MPRIGSIVTCAVVLLVTVQARAELITFTDRTTWENAVVSVSTFDFNSEATGSFVTDRDFGYFTATNTNWLQLTTFVEDGSGDANVNGTNYLGFNEAVPSGTTPLRLTFDTAISALGFDYRTIDDNSDGFDLVIGMGGTLFNVSPSAPSNGFFGVIDTVGLFTVADFQDDVDGGGLNLGVGIDNLSYGVTAVPEPNTFVALLGIVSVSLLARDWQRKRQLAE